MRVDEVLERLLVCIVTTVTQGMMEKRFRLLLRSTRHTNDMEHRHTLCERYNTNYEITYDRMCIGLPTSCYTVDSGELTDSKGSEQDANRALLHTTISIGSISGI